MKSIITLLLFNAFMVVLPCIGAYLAWKHSNLIGWKTLLTWLLFRSALVFILFYFGEAEPYDLHGWYLHASWINHGNAPGTDFLTPYSIGFEYLCAIAVWLWNSEYSIAILFLLFEGVAMSIIYMALSDLYGGKTAKRAVILAETSPVLIINALYTQDEPVALCGLALVLLTCIKRKLIWQIISIFIVCLMSKILMIFYIFWLFASKGLKGCLYLICAVGAYFFVSYTMGVSPLCFRFSRELHVGLSADAILTSLPVESNSIYYYMPSVPSGVRNVVLVVVFTLVSLCILKILWRGNVKCALAAQVVWCFFLHFFYPYFFSAYWIPLLPVLMAILCDETRFLGGSRFAIPLSILWGEVMGFPFLLTIRLSWFEPCRIVIWIVFAVVHLMLLCYVFSHMIQVRQKGITTIP